MPAALQTLRVDAERSGTAALFRRFADAAAAARFFSEAATAYAREAAIYRKSDPNAAQVESLKSAACNTDIELFQQRTTLGWNSPKPAAPRARLEPERGCYIGAFIDRDDNLPNMMMQSQTYGDVKAFARRVGKTHASYFMYRQYGQPFPSQWVEYLKVQGAIPHIALEPRSLAEVRDDKYLQDFVDAARDAHWPIFIRFAGEMNGDWTPYHGNPAAYRQAFRLVYRAFRAAPRVALIWCPNTVPQNNLDDYYPGDDAVDWVGVNFYSVYFLDNDRTRPAGDLNPVDLLDYVYRRYSARKPIAIAEFAATHEAQIDHVPRVAFAVDKMAQLYRALPALYPRVKLVDWYDCNNLVHASPGRQLNNYLLTDVPEITAAYARAVASPWFLGSDSVRSGEPAPVETVALRTHDSVFRADSIQAWVRTYCTHPHVYFRLDGRVVKATARLDNMFIDAATMRPGHHRLEVLVYDDRQAFVGSREVLLTR
jgi:hypothetical protein